MLDEPDRQGRARKASRSRRSSASAARASSTKDGAIDRGAQNLPGNWESSNFHLPRAIHEAIPKIGDDETAIVMHNDAVVQGLSEAPFMSDVKRWGVLTIGTGLGNARFTNRAAAGRIDAPAPRRHNPQQNAAGGTLKPAPFAYAKARSVDHAIELLARTTTRGCWPAARA